MWATTSVSHITSSSPPLGVAQETSRENFRCGKVAGKTGDAGVKHSVDAMAGKEKIRYISISIHSYRKGSYLAGPLPSPRETIVDNTGGCGRRPSGWFPLGQSNANQTYAFHPTGPQTETAEEGLTREAYPRASAYAPSPSVGNLAPQPLQGAAHNAPQRDGPSLRWTRRKAAARQKGRANIA